MTPEAGHALQQLLIAADKLGKLAGSAPLSQRNGAENRYGLAYQRLVRLGERPQIRAKYRKGQ